MNLQQAIDCPAFHTEHLPSSFYPRAMRPGVVVLEAGFPEAARAELTRRGAEAWSESRLSACAREETPAGTILQAAANSHGLQGYLVGR
jgi:gamma-glutamyltranspeptidase/glutathione hydrolase